MSKRKLVLFVTLPPALGWKQRLSEIEVRKGSMKVKEGKNRVIVVHCYSHRLSNILPTCLAHRRMHHRSMCYRL